MNSVVAATRRLPQPCEERLANNYTFRPGDDERVYDPATIAAHAENASALIVTPSESMDAATFAVMPKTVKVISTFSVGFEHIDLSAARVHGIRVANTPGVLTDATADLTMLLILGATRRASEGERILRSGRWKGVGGSSRFLGHQITGRRLGILGMGRVGTAVVRRALAFGMQTFYYSRKPNPDAEELGARYVTTLDELLRQSQVLSLHAPLTPETKGLLNAERIELLPEGAVVVNTARGGLVDDSALIGALRSGKLAAAGLDVYANEPNLDPRYLTLENVMLLPHLGSATIETRTAMGMRAIDNIDTVLRGAEPLYPVV